MSLVGQALVIAGANAIMGKTWADTRVSRQPVDPLDGYFNSDGPQRPVVAVYVDEAKFDIEGKATSGRKGSLDFKVYVYIVPAVTTHADPSTGEIIADLLLDISTAGMTLDFMGRLVDYAFHSQSPWVDIWNKLVSSVTSRSEKYALYQTDKGVRIPGLEITYRLETVPDPLYGAKMADMAGWKMLDDALRQDGADGIMLADFFKAMIELGPDNIPDYKKMQLAFGFTDAATAATGLSPLPGATDDDGDVVLLQEVTVIQDED